MVSVDAWHGHVERSGRIRHTGWRIESMLSRLSVLIRVGWIRSIVAKQRGLLRLVLIPDEVVHLLHLDLAQVHDLAGLGEVLDEPVDVHLTGQEFLRDDLRFLFTLSRLGFQEGEGGVQ